MKETQTQERRETFLQLTSERFQLDTDIFHDYSQFDSTIFHHNSNSIANNNTVNFGDIATAYWRCHIKHVKRVIAITPRPSRV
jgi:hypothetical protein